MESKSQNKAPLQRQGKFNHYLASFVIAKLESKFGKTYQILKAELSPEKLFYTALKYVSCSKKAICTILNIDVEYQCWEKRKLENKGLLWVIEVGQCPIIPKAKNVQILSTNKELAKKLGLIKDSGNE